MLSIIIATLNEERYLPKLLRDLLEQNYKDYEIIVVDGNSVDKTVDYAKKFNCKIFITKKRSQQYQQNLAAKNAKGEILLFLDADTRIRSKEFIRKNIEEFTKKNYVCATFFTKFNSKKIKYKFSELLLNLIAIFGEYVYPTAHGGSGIISLKKYHDFIKGFDENMFIGEDHEYAKKMSKFGKTGVIKSVRTEYSIRRFDKEGVLKLWLMWAYFMINRFVLGKTHKPLINYEMKGGGDYT